MGLNTVSGSAPLRFSERRMQPKVKLPGLFATAHSESTLGGMNGALGLLDGAMPPIRWRGHESPLRLSRGGR